MKGVKKMFTKGDFIKSTASKQNIELRTKLKSALRDCHCEDLTDSIIKTICQVNRKSYQDALSLFWLMNYNPDMGFQLLGYITESNSQNVLYNYPQLKFIPKELEVKLKNELRYQYISAHPDFTSNINDPVPEGAQEMYVSLERKSDIVTAKVVYNHCRYCIGVFTEEEISRCRFLINSEEEKLHYGGIRSLGFTTQEADFLKPYYIQIANLLDGLCVTRPSNNNIPEAFERSEYLEALKEEPQAPETRYVNPDFGGIPLEDLVKYQNDILEYIKLYEKLQSVGVSPEKVILYGQKIKEVLE